MKHNTHDQNVRTQADRNGVFHQMGFALHQAQKSLAHFCSGPGWRQWMAAMDRAIEEKLAGREPEIVCPVPDPQFVNQRLVNAFNAVKESCSAAEYIQSCISHPTFRNHRKKITEDLEEYKQARGGADAPFPPENADFWKKYDPTKLPWFDYLQSAEYGRHVAQQQGKAQRTTDYVKIRDRNWAGRDKLGEPFCHDGVGGDTVATAKKAMGALMRFLKDQAAKTDFDFDDKILAQLDGTEELMEDETAREVVEEAESSPKSGGDGGSGLLLGAFKLVWSLMKTFGILAILKQLLEPILGENAAKLIDGVEDGTQLASIFGSLGIDRSQGTTMIRTVVDFLKDKLDSDTIDSLVEQVPALKVFLSEGKKEE
ncbi:MAG: hypothetical protein SGARI_001371 [Bacillariaceae sp.]